MRDILAAAVLPGLLFGTPPVERFDAERCVENLRSPPPRIPLDMSFLAKDGIVVGALEQVPVLNEEPRSVGCAAAYVLEVNAGWSREHGVTPGMKASIQL